ncbi:uncharacterized protein LOC128737660 [Sabethes cyaneus]|uniref:uncharacterized protein LOC128737660 n=1 Tax=Sabethes cyaneus TaxID=53552 RepID=UPI00237DC445|nr:uncharacterized protein LOC128737660 [Sabethes cyaneus]
MRVFCIFEKCGNQRKQVGDDISYFSFPKNTVLLREWMDFINQYNVSKLTLKTLNRKRMKMCHLHFEKKQIIMNFNNRTLWRGAVPCCPPGIIDEEHFQNFSRKSNKHKKSTCTDSKYSPLQTSFDGKPPLYHSMHGYMVDLRIAALQDNFRLPSGKVIQVRRQLKAQLPTLPQSSNLQEPAKSETSEKEAELQNSLSESLQNETQSDETEVAYSANTTIQPESSTDTSPSQRYSKTYTNKRALNHSTARGKEICQPSRPVRPSSMDLITLQEQTNEEPTTVELPTTIEETTTVLNLPRITKKASKRSVSANKNSMPNSTPASEAGSHSRPPQKTAHLGNLVPPTLTAIQGLMYKGYKKNEYGTFQKQFDDQLISAAETSLHMVSKINTLLNSNPYKHASNRGDLKELYITVSYFLKYAIDRFKGLEEEAINGIRSMGYTELADMGPVLGELASTENQNSSDSESDDDCAIIEQQTDLIEIESDAESDADSEQTVNSSPMKNTPDSICSNSGNMTEDGNGCETTAENTASFGCQAAIESAVDLNLPGTEETPSPMDESEELQMIVMQETTETTEITYYQEDEERADDMALDLRDEPPLNIEGDLSDASMEEEQELIEIIDGDAEIEQDDRHDYKVVDLIDGEFYLLS